jgi:cytidylate kinase
MVRVITIAREYGAGGASVARRLAETLRWKLLDRELIAELAERLRCSAADVARYDEHPPSFLSRMMRAYWSGSVDTWSGAPRQPVIDADTLATMTADIIREAAELGSCVIVGRGSQCLLRERNDVFSVFLYAPREERLRRLRQRHASESEAEAAMTEVDRLRAAYIRRYHGQDWTDRHLYDLMINSKIGDVRVASSILTAASLIAEGN